MATNKIKFKLKITGFELEVEGSKEEVATITSAVSNQLRGLTSPQFLTDINITEEAESTDVSTATQLPSPKKRANRKPGTSNVKQVKADAIDYKNDPTKYNSPTMKWSALQKALWVIYVVHNEKQISELSITQICKTFNKHHKQSKIIRASNISRDFGKVKQGQKALVGENTTVLPTTWYLTTEGEKTVQDLIKEVKN